MPGGVPIAFVAGMKAPYKKENRDKSSFAAPVGVTAAPQNQAKRIFCRFLRDTVFVKRLAYAIGLAVCSLIIFVQSSAHAAGVDIAWAPSSDPSVVGYNLYYGGASGVYTNKIYVGDVTSAIITGLTPGATYYFAATSVSANGKESGYSAEISYTVPGALMLVINTTQTGGVVTSISLTATGDIPAQWIIEGSTDLQTWSPVVSGTNSPVNVSLPATELPCQFFRLVNQ